MSSESFKNITKWQQRTNGHSRDAAMLVFAAEPVRYKTAPTYKPKIRKRYGTN